MALVVIGLAQVPLTWYLYSRCSRPSLMRAHAQARAFRLVLIGLVAYAMAWIVRVVLQVIVLTTEGTSFSGWALPINLAWILGLAPALAAYFKPALVVRLTGGATTSERLRRDVVQIMAVIGRLPDLEEEDHARLDELLRGLDRWRTTTPHWRSTSCAPTPNAELTEPQSMKSRRTASPTI